MKTFSKILHAYFQLEDQKASALTKINPIKISKIYEEIVAHARSVTSKHGIAAKSKKLKM